MKIAFIGHRKVCNEERLKNELHNITERYILSDAADEFLFGSKSEFDSLCHDVVTELKEQKYPHIRRVYVRGEYEHVSDSYNKYLHKFYEYTFFPDKISGANAIRYVERNQIMIDMCDVLILYCKEPPGNNGSGAAIAYNYALKRKKQVINVYNVIDENEEYIDFYAVKSVMKDRGVTLADFAGKMSGESYEKFESCYFGGSQTETTANMLFEIAAVLNVKVTELVKSDKPAKREKKHIDVVEYKDKLESLLKRV